ncbi:hypothetical protein B5C34_04280 [Pacificimonas flava]|uniref:Heparinase II/III-like C-terminal domain-containing protein n=2 Tax=Pacificimonas TaxID=1960290 RepID=A0A219B3I1_9SPHN|nr:MULTISPECIES: heparinase II/III family protein [Pacificimonas]MBZ6377564.1 heparinase II/III family protein [Pacificimonas aurantium]OWV32744.1 hypothetical protein B5C34_04280 [Pacificimonas flava]
MSLLERFGLKRRVPLRLVATLGDPVPGDAEAARALLKGEIVWRGERFVLRSGDWDLPSASEAFRTHVHGFAWLRDLAAAMRPDEATEFLSPILDGWLSRYGDPGDLAWRADRAGLRAAFWILHAPLVLNTDAERRKTLLKTLVMSALHAERTGSKLPRGMPRLHAAAGVTLGALLIDGGGPAPKRAEKLQADAAESTVLPHGLPASRAPADLLAVLEWVQVCRLAYQAVREPLSPPLEELDARARAGLKAARLGDGRLTALHGGNICRRSRIDHALGWPGQAQRGIGAGADSGLQRLENGRTVLLFDAGPPPEPADNEAAHAGALAFEMSDEAERVIVNVGGDRGLRGALDARLKTPVRYSAAHSTLILADTNQSAVARGEPLGAGVDTVSVEREDEDNGLRVTATHDGYRAAFGFLHERALRLSETGREIEGVDRLIPAGRKRRRAAELAIRFHLAPGLDITPTADLRGALVRTRSGALWQLKTDSGTVSVDDSLWIGEEGRAIRTRQLVVSDEAPADGWSGRWTFRKMG